jgi:hypothetical protein
VGYLKGKGAHSRGPALSEWSAIMLVNIYGLFTDFRNLGQTKRSLPGSGESPISSREKLLEECEIQVPR